jgi:probable rRNA maturation factor
VSRSVREAVYVPESGRVPDRGGKGPGSAGEPTEPPVLLGDVYVCPSVAVRQAAERSIEIDAELALLVVHGLLHLLDYDHTEPDETEAMQGREREILASFAELESRS